MNEIKGTVAPYKMNLRTVFFKTINYVLITGVLILIGLGALVSLSGNNVNYLEIPFVITLSLVIIIMLILNALFAVYYKKNYTHIKFEKRLMKIILGNEEFVVRIQEAKANASASESSSSSSATVKNKIINSIVVDYILNFEKEQLILKLRMSEGLNAAIVTDNSPEYVSEYFSRKLGDCKIIDEKQKITFIFEEFTV